MMRKRFIAIFLMMAMMISTIPAMAEKNQSEEIPSFLECMGIGLPEEAIEQEDSERPVTKAEFVYLVVQAMGKNAFAQQDYLTFPDVKLDAWYHDNVITAADKGLVFGREDGFFGVDDNVTEEIASVIMLRALGFGILPSDTGNTDLFTRFSGVRTKLLKGITRDGTLTLNEAYRAIYNMLLSDYVALNFTENITYRVETEHVYMEYAFDIRKETGRVTGNQYTRFGLSAGSSGKNRLEIDGVIYETNLPDDEVYLGYVVDYFVDDSNDSVVIHMIPRAENEVTEILSDDIENCEVIGSNIIIKYRNASGNVRSAKIPISCDFVYNGKAENFSKLLIDELITEKLGSIKIVENDSYAMLEVTAYDTMIVDTVSTYDEVIYGRYGVSPISVKEMDGEFLVIEKDGETCSISDINKDDVIQVASTLDGLSKKIIICNFTISGAITEGVDGEEIQIDGIMYPVSNYFRTYRLANITIRLGINQKYLFNTYGELVDIVEDSAEYVGEYVFLIEAKDMSGAEEHLVRVRYVTMDASMVTSYLAEKVIYNGTKSWAEYVPQRLLPVVSGVAQRRIVYIEKNSEGKISVINTEDQTDVNGTFNQNDMISRDAVEKNRKCKQQSAWLEDTNDANFPEFYTDENTKILLVPVSTASDEVFKDMSNYEVKNSGYFQDAKDYIVEAYNLDEYNVAEIMLLRQEQRYDTQRSNNNMILVKAVGATINDDGEVIPKIKGYQDGEYVEITLKDSDVSTYQNKPTQKIKKFDVVRFNVDGKGYAIHSEYIKNVLDDKDVTSGPEGQNNGNAIAVGKVVSQKDKYLRVKFPGTSAPDRVFRGSVPSVTIFDGNDCYKGTMADLVPGSLVIVRVFYTTLNDIIIIK